MTTRGSAASGEKPQYVSVKDFGANPATTGNNVTPLTSAIAFEPLGHEVTVPVGQYRFDTGVTVTSGPIELIGEGAGAGPGTVTNSNCSQLYTNYASGDFLKVSSTTYGSRFENFQINSGVGQRTSGSAIKLDATGLGSVVSNYRINNIAFNNQYNDIETVQGGIGVVENTFHYSWKNIGLVSSGDGVHEGLTGFVTNNYFFGDTAAATTQVANIQTNNGYGWISHNMLLGSTVAVRNQTGEYPNGNFQVTNNSLEEHDVAGIYMFQSNSQTASMAALNWNQFSNATLAAASRSSFQGHIVTQAGTPTNWLTTFQIVGNRMRSSCAASTGGFINVQGGARGQIIGNTLEGLTDNTTRGIKTGNSTNVTQCDVMDNMIYGNFTTKYQISNTEVMFRDFSSRLTASELTAIVVHDGSLAWCEDGCPGSNPLTGGGSGCIAIREGGAWKGRAPQTSTTANAAGTYTVLDTDTSIVSSAASTITLPAAASYIGREIRFLTTGANALTSASSNVIALTGGAAGTAITAATAGKWVVLKSNGTNWQIVMGN